MVTPGLKILGHSINNLLLIAELTFTLTQESAYALFEHIGILLHLLTTLFKHITHFLEVLK